MSDELKAATNRLSQCRGLLGVEGVYGISIRVNQKRIQSDRRLLADAYLDTLDEQQRIAEMRELRLTWEWTCSFATFQCASYCGWLHPDGCVEVDTDGRVHFGGILIVAIKTRGQLLDLLAALKIEPKGKS